LISGTTDRPAPAGGRVPVLLRGPLARVGLITATVGLLASCAVPAEQLPGSAPPSVGASSSATPTPTAPTSPPAAGQGTLAPSQVDRFVPVRLILPGREAAKVEPVSTVDGELQVPKDVEHLGWWDGSSWLNDPFGSTVIAGHVDSATEGLGFFAQLLRVKKGERVQVLGAEGQKQTFRVSSVRTVDQNALADDSRALAQTGDHRLVLITCTGAYRPGRGYEANLVVTATLVERR
jgi:LPXTG-site transpeptidase (sortase) family protein